MESIVNINKIDPSRYCVQPKLNGIWAEWNSERKGFFTKGGHQVKSLSRPVFENATRGRSFLTAAYKKMRGSLMAGRLIITGELYSHDLSFQKIESIVMGSAPDTAGLIEFFEFRKIIKHYPKTKTELKKTYKAILSEGYEGIVLTHLVTGKQYKLKPKQDAEATLVEFLPGTGKNKGTFGALRLRLESGVEFNCSGIKDKERLKLWKDKPIGSQVTFLYSYLSDAGVPISPSYKCIRRDNIKAGRPVKPKSEYRGVRKLYRWTEGEYEDIKKAVKVMRLKESEVIRRAVLNYIRMKI